MIGSITRHRAALAALMLLLAACDRPESAASPTTPAVPDVPAGATWTLEEVYAVGGPVTGRRFGDVRGLALHADGRLAVVDNASRQVSVFGAHGGYGEPAGSFGAGPDQYKDPYHAAWLDDTLAIYDPEMNRVLFLAGGRRAVGQIPALKLLGAITARFYPVSAKKAFLRSMLASGEQFVPAFVGMQGRRAVDTIRFANPAPLPNGTICRPPGGAPVWFDWPESPVDLIVPVRADGATATARTTEYRIVVRGPRGDSLLTIQRPTTAVPLTEAEWNAGIAPYTQFVARYGADVCEARPTRPAHRAPVRALATSSDGELWVTSIGASGLAFDVFALDGTRRATISAPPHVTAIPIAISHERLSLVTQNTDGAYAVRTYRIVRPAAP